MADQKVEYFDDLTGEVLNHKGQRLDERGREMPDPRPMRPPIGYNPQPPLHELIRQMVRSEHLRQAAEAVDAGSFEEEDDFDVDDDDYDPTSPWEENFDPIPGEGQRPSETSSSEAEPPSPSPDNSPSPATEN